MKPIVYQAAMESRSSYIFRTRILPAAIYLAAAMALVVIARSIGI